jgi:hypothetical protein
MITTVIKSVAVLATLACVAFVWFCAQNRIHSVSDFRNFRIMRSINDPIVMALADGKLIAGSTTQQMLATENPVWTHDYGRCKIFGFVPERSYDHQTVMAVDGHLVSASVGSCTWRWSFFNQVPEEVADSVGHVRALRELIEQMPHIASHLRPQLDKHYAVLGIQVSAAEP